MSKPKSIYLVFYLALATISLTPKIVLGDTNSTAPDFLLPPEDIPEEILRAEIITEGRSPFDGKPLSAAEYAELEAEIAESSYAPELNRTIKHNILLLRLQKLFNYINPFAQ